jgi:glycerol-3-phosphate acyltransferase PlsY
MSTWVLFTILMLAFVSPRDAFYAALLTLFLGWRHQKNFRNLVAQRELRGRSANSSGPGSSSR